MLGRSWSFTYEKISRISSNLFTDSAKVKGLDIQCNILCAPVAASHSALRDHHYQLTSTLHFPALQTWERSAIFLWMFSATTLCLHSHYSLPANTSSLPDNRSDFWFSETIHVSAKRRTIWMLLGMSSSTSACRAALLIFTCFCALNNAISWYPTLPNVSLSFSYSKPNWAQ